MPKFSPEAISARLAELLQGLTDEDVVQQLKTYEYVTSTETIRRYRKGIAQRISADFLGALALAYKTNPMWLLTGDGPRTPLPLNLANAFDAGVREALGEMRGAIEAMEGRLEEWEYQSTRPLLRLEGRRLEDFLAHMGNVLSDEEETDLRYLLEHGGYVSLDFVDPEDEGQEEVNGAQESTALLSDLWRVRPREVRLASELFELQLFRRRKDEEMRKWLLRTYPWISAYSEKVQRKILDALETVYDEADHDHLVMHRAAKRLAMQLQRVRNFQGSTDTDLFKSIQDWMRNDRHEKFVAPGEVESAARIVAAGDLTSPVHPL